MVRHTNVARKNKEVIVGKTAVVLGVEQSLDIDAVTLGVFLLQNLESRVEVEELLLGEDGNLLHAVTVEDRHGCVVLR